MKKNLALVIFLVAIALPLTIILGKQSQDTRSKAAGVSAKDVAVGQSIQSAIDSANAGATVNVAAGTYNETLNISKSGITIQATGGRVITNGTMKISGQNVKLIGFTVKGSGSFGAQVDGADGLLLKDFEIDGSQDGGVIISGSKNVVVDGCNIHGTNAKGTSADGEALSITGGSIGFEVKNCQVHDNGEEGIDAKYNGAGDVNGTIHDNQVFGNRGPNIYVDGSSGVKIYNNTSHGTTEGSKAGIMIAAETSYGGSENPKHAGNIDIFNNVIYGNAGGGITYWVESGGSLSDIRVYNNTVDESKPLNIDTSPSGTNPIFNNIFTSNPNGGGIQLGNNLTSNPGFVGNGDYHLTAGSAAIDKGTATGAPTFDHDNKARPAGAGVDMGAYEFGATGGTNPSTAPQPTNITPTLYCLGGVPCDGPSPSSGNTNPSPSTSQEPGNGSINPSTNPEPSVNPCNTDSGTTSAFHGKHHRKWRHGGGGFFEMFMQFLLKLIQYLLGGSGGQIPGFPSPSPGPGTPCPSPSATVSTPPSTAPSTSLSTVPSAVVSPSTTVTTGTIRLGAAVEPDQLDDAAFTGALKTYKFDSLTPENAMKFGPLEPSQGQFDWAGADKIVNYAQANNMRVRGHNLLWYIEVPGWVNGLSNDQAAAALENHIKTVVGRYKGKIAQWDVVNEAFNDDGTLRSYVWSQKLGNDYMAKAFQWAHEADPNAQLYYNDYGMESSDSANGGKPAKADAVYNMVKDFKARGIPINGVGFQTHSSGEYPGTGTALKANMERLKALGVNVEITELDVINHGDETSKAERYAEVGTACKDAGNCTGVTTWGLYDGHTWLPGDAPLLLDTNFKAKPSYTSLTKAIGR